MEKPFKIFKPGETEPSKQKIITELRESQDNYNSEKFRIFHKLALAKELAQRNEPFPFPGIKKETYDELKKIEEEFPDYCVPIDPLLERFEKEGFRVVFSKENPESGNVFIIPSQSTDIKNDNLFPRQLDINNILDEDLSKLALIDIFPIK